MSVSLDDLRTALADYEDILTFEEVGDFIKVKMEYQHGERGKATWEAVNAQIKEFGGEWVSEGKWSHWKVPKGKRETPQKPTKASIFDKEIEEMKQIVTSLDRKLEIFKRLAREAEN